MKQVETLRVELAAYYCEDESSFLLDEAFKVIRAFCDKLQKAIKVFARIVFASKHRLHQTQNGIHHGIQSNWASALREPRAPKSC